MEHQDIQRLAPQDIAKHLAEQREELRRLRFAAAEGSLKEHRRIRAVRQTIARLLTAQARRAPSVTAS